MNQPTELRSFSRSLPMVLLRCRDAVMARFRPLLRDHGLSEQQWRILRALASGGTMRAGDLAAQTLLSAPSLSRLMKTLAQRQLIRRVANADDLRSSRISITPEGHRLVQRIAPSSEAIYAEIGGVIGAVDLDQLYRLLAGATARLDGTSGASSIESCGKSAATDQANAAPAYKRD